MVRDFMKDSATDLDDELGIWEFESDVLSEEDGDAVGRHSEVITPSLWERHALVQTQDANVVRILMVACILLHNHSDILHLGEDPLREFGEDAFYYLFECLALHDVIVGAPPAEGGPRTLSIAESSRDGGGR